MNEIWLDMNLPIAPWIGEQTGMPCRHFSEMGLHSAPDREIFQLAYEAKAVVFTKDADYAQLIWQNPAAPQIVWIRFGNITNQRLRQLLMPLLPKIFDALRSGEPLLEITEAEHDLC